jgi:hypothetical protein
MKNKAIQEMLDDADILDMEDIHEVEYRGHSMQFTDYELKQWNELTRSHKRAYAEAQKKALKSGKYIKVKRPEGGYGIISRAEAKEKGLI